MTAQIITIIRDDKNHLTRTMVGNAVPFEPGHLCMAVAKSFDESLMRSRAISELVKNQSPHHD